MKVYLAWIFNLKIAKKNFSFKFVFDILLRCFLLLFMLMMPPQYISQNYKKKWSSKCVVKVNFRKFAALR